jgi:cytochrome c553
MKSAPAACLLLAAMLVTGCGDLSRSRDLANPRVSAVTLASQVCSNCHGLAGVSVSPNFPNLAAQTPEYLAAQLKEFRSHGRMDPAGFRYMWGISRHLADEQIAGLAAYYAAQPPAAGAPTGGNAAGREIFLTGLPEQKVAACASCHGAAGQGNGPFPRLAGQHRDYVIKQLAVFQRGTERPAGAVMNTVAHGLNPRDIAEVAVYVESMSGVAPAK